MLNPKERFEKRVNVILNEIKLLALTNNLILTKKELEYTENKIIAEIQITTTKLSKVPIIFTLAE